MPRIIGTIQSRVSKYFEKVEPENENCTKYICKILTDRGPCNKQYEGKKKSNLTAHIESVHPVFYKEKIVALPFCENEMLLRRLEFIQHRAEIVAVNLRPFSALSDSGFKKSSSRELNELAMAGYESGLNDGDHKIYKEYIDFAASQIRARITKEMKKTFVSLLADITTKHNRAFLGIQVQYDHDKKTVNRSLGVVLLNEKHTAANLKQIIFERLALFGVSEMQISTFTVDNGSNFISMIKLVNETFGNNDIIPPILPQDENEGSTTNEIVEVTQNLIPFSDDEIHLTILEAEADAETGEDFETDSNNDDDDDFDYLDDPDEYDKLLEELGNDFVLRTQYLNGIRCAEHTFQLGVNDMLQSESVVILMRLAKAAAIKLRKQSYRNKLIENKIEFKIPRNCCPTRWGSENVMVRI